MRFWMLKANSLEQSSKSLVAIGVPVAGIVWGLFADSQVSWEVASSITGSVAFAGALTPFFRDIVVRSTRQQEFRFPHKDGIEEVALIGDFTVWEKHPKQMSRSNGHWRISVPLTIGETYLYEFKIHRGETNETGKVWTKEADPELGVMSVKYDTDADRFRSKILIR